MPFLPRLNLISRHPKATQTTHFDLLQFDLNGNGVADAYDIATGSLSDEDLDGIPDEAQARDEDEEGSPRG